MPIRNWFRYRGVRLIVCPETFQPAAVKVDARRAAKLRLDACSRWPDREGCDQACLAQIESSPEKSALETIVDGWFLGKRCYFCRHTIADSGSVVLPLSAVCCPLS